MTWTLKNEFQVASGEAEPKDAPRKRSFQLRLWGAILRE